jgi:hypothetical protein
VPSLREFEERGISISRLEERHWLGREQRDPAAIPARGWHHDPEPTEEEESER